MNLFIAFILVIPGINMLTGTWVGINLFVKLLQSREVLPVLVGLALALVWFVFGAIIFWVVCDNKQPGLPLRAILLHFVLSYGILEYVDSVCKRKGITCLKDERVEPNGRQVTFFFWFRR